MSSDDYNKWKLTQLNNSIQAIEKQLGVSGVTFDNYTQKAKKAGKVTQEQVKLWDTLGNTLLQAKEVENSLAEAQKQAAKQAAEAAKQAAEAQKQALQTKYDSTMSSINSFTSIYDSLTDTIDKFKNVTLGSTYSLDKFYKTIRVALDADPSNVDAYSNAVNEAIKYSDAVLNSDNFSSARDMKFAQLVATNQFEALQNNTKTQIDYLREIANNTKIMIGGSPDTNTPANSTTNQTVGGSSVVIDGVVDNMFDTGKAMKISNLYMDMIGKIPSNKEIQTLISSGVTDDKLAGTIYSSIKRSGGLDAVHADQWKQLHTFSDGGIVTSATLGLIGEAGYNEAVIPLKNPNDPLSMGAVVQELKALRKEVKELRADNKNYQSKIENNTKVLLDNRRYA
jgi:hypothetical protein